MDAAPLSLSPSTPPLSAFRRWGLVGGLLTLATLAGWLVEPSASLTSQAMLYVLAVVLASYQLDWVASVVCAVGAVTALNFFFVPPRWTFQVESQEHVIALAVMLVLALVISRLAAGLRRETAIARLNEWRARQLQSLASALAAASSAQQVLTLGRTALAAAFEGPCVLVSVEALDSGTDVPDARVRDGLRCCMKEAAVLGPGTGRWPGLAAWYLPLREGSHMAGAACVQPALASDVEGRAHAQALCALLAQALWRLTLNHAMVAAQGEAQRQQLQSTFLAAISHDLRTPLAAIVGAASALQTQHDKLGPVERTRLLDSLASEAAYLSTVTENTLQLVRLESPGRVLSRNWESMEEIVGAVLARMRLQDPGHRIHAQVPKGLPLIKADPVLLSQLLGNLLDNACKWARSSVAVHAVSVMGSEPPRMQVQRLEVQRRCNRPERQHAGPGAGARGARPWARHHAGAAADDVPTVQPWRSRRSAWRRSGAGGVSCHCPGA